MNVDGLCDNESVFRSYSTLIPRNTKPSSAQLKLPTQLQQLKLPTQLLQQQLKQPLSAQPTTTPSYLSAAYSPPQLTMAAVCGPNDTFGLDHHSNGDGDHTIDSLATTSLPTPNTTLLAPNSSTHHHSPSANNPMLEEQYQFLPTQNPPSHSEYKSYVLKIRQQPKQARCSSVSEKGADKRPLDPLPILQLTLDDPNSKDSKAYLHNPFFFVYATLLDPDTSKEFLDSKDVGNRVMSGSTASSLHRLRDIDGTYGGFFVFPDISIRHEGRFRLKFTLFEILSSGEDPAVPPKVSRRNSVISDIFTVYQAKLFPGMTESSALSRFFAEQGLKIRIRKDSNGRKGTKRGADGMESEPDSKNLSLTPLRRGLPGSVPDGLNYDDGYDRHPGMDPNTYAGRPPSYKQPLPNGSHPSNGSSGSGPMPYGGHPSDPNASSYAHGAPPPPPTQAVYDYWGRPIPPSNYYYRPPVYSEGHPPPMYGHPQSSHLHPHSQQQQQHPSSRYAYGGDPHRPSPPHPHQGMHPSQHHGQHPPPPMHAQQHQQQSHHQQQQQHHQQQQQQHGHPPYPHSNGAPAYPPPPPPHYAGGYPPRDHPDDSYAPPSMSVNGGGHGVPSRPPSDPSSSSMAAGSNGVDGGSSNTYSRPYSYPLQHGSRHPSSGSPARPMGEHHSMIVPKIEPGQPPVQSGTEPPNPDPRDASPNGVMPPSRQMGYPYRRGPSPSESSSYVPIANSHPTPMGRQLPTVGPISPRRSGHAYGHPNHHPHSHPLPPHQPPQHPSQHPAHLKSNTGPTIRGSPREYWTGSSAPRPYGDGSPSAGRNLLPGYTPRSYSQYPPSSVSRMDVEPRSLSDSLPSYPPSHSQKHSTSEPSSRSLPSMHMSGPSGPQYGSLPPMCAPREGYEGGSEAPPPMGTSSGPSSADDWSSKQPAFHHSHPEHRTGVPSDENQFYSHQRTHPSDPLRERDLDIKTNHQ
ncbi:hypothetical protein BASA50_002151 [Batrachochytrium salamandrivorans]|uniref:Velvet domain-containing protein n=1 Tax=Batrachochytrium salamandrivorans TaxID=1357716 RepID=A0ABQ8FM05_9FUNG|nr:hypothetical protein BASA50_002151 [Batrachochytrium salamandrivorans]